MSTTSRTAKCQHCGQLLPSDHRGPCPACKKEGKDISIHLANGILVSSGTLSLAHFHEFYEKNVWALILVILITALSSIIGLLVAGLMGVILGLILGLISILIGPKAVTKVRQITKIHYH
jgi:uncharacterized oligopeptide transporter (OPT) family protein